MDHPTPGTAVVADRRPLERSLLRFLLGEAGFAVRAEAGTMSDLLLALQRESPDAVVLHEHLARGRDEAAIAQVRWLVPEATIVVVARDPERLPAALVAIADEAIADGVGLAGLALAVTSARGRAESATDRVAIAAPPSIAPAARTSRRRWVERLQGAVAASVVALAVLALRGGGTPPGPGGDAGVAAAPSQDAGPLAPDRTAVPPNGSEGATGDDGVVPLAHELATAPASPVLMAGPVPQAEPEEAPAPTGTDPVPTGTDPVPTGTDPVSPPDPSVGPAEPEGVGGPPVAVMARLKAKVNALVSQLPPRRGGRPDRPPLGVPGGSGSPAAPGPSSSPGTNGNRPPWAGHPPGRGNGNDHGGGPPGRGNGNDHGGGPPGWAHGPRP